MSVHMAVPNSLCFQASRMYNIQVNKKFFDQYNLSAYIKLIYKMKNCIFYAKYLYKYYISRDNCD